MIPESTRRGVQERAGDSKAASEKHAARSVSTVGTWSSVAPRDSGGWSRTHALELSSCHHHPPSPRVRRELEYPSTNSGPPVGRAAPRALAAGQENPQAQKNRCRRLDVGYGNTWVVRI